MLYLLIAVQRRDAYIISVDPSSNSPSDFLCKVASWKANFHPSWLILSKFSLTTGCPTIPTMQHEPCPPPTRAIPLHVQPPSTKIQGESPQTTRGALKVLPVKPTYTLLLFLIPSPFTFITSPPSPSFIPHPRFNDQK